MSESNNVKFVEENGKWLWKRYDADGSVTYRSGLFETESEARADYEMNNGGVAPEASSEVTPETPSEQAPEGSMDGGADVATGPVEGEQVQQDQNENSAGTATL